MSMKTVRIRIQHVQDVSKYSIVFKNNSEKFRQILQPTLRHALRRAVQLQDVAAPNKVTGFFRGPGPDSRPSKYDGEKSKTSKYERTQLFGKI